MRHEREKQFAAILTITALIVSMGIVVLLGRFASENLLAVLAVAVATITLIARATQ